MVTSLCCRRGLIAIAAAFFAFSPALLKATVQEQRNRLPPPARCDDPVEGVWRAHKYDARYNDWHIQTLTIRRQRNDEGKKTDTLDGTIHARWWDGGPEVEEPPPCHAGSGNHYTMIMNARGSISKDGFIIFGGVDLRRDKLFCGHWLGYNIDNFSGMIDADLQEFQSVNNDGGRAVNDPVVFRRISCGNDAPREHHNPIAPPFMPPNVRGGCNCSL